MALNIDLPTTYLIWSHGSNRRGYVSSRSVIVIVIATSGKNQEAGEDQAKDCFLHVNHPPVEEKNYSIGATSQCQHQSRCKFTEKERDASFGILIYYNTIYIVIL
jgi:hypothetical protein